MSGATAKVTYLIPPGAPPRRCKGAGCNRLIYFVQTGERRSMPVDPDGTPHWATCPNSADFKERARLERRLAELRAEVAREKGR